MQNYEKIIEPLQEQKYTQATALLSRFCVSYMDEQDFAQLEECLAQIPDEVKRKSGQLCFLEVSAELRRGPKAAASIRFGQIPPAPPLSVASARPFGGSSGQTSPESRRNWKFF